MYTTIDCLESTPKSALFNDIYYSTENGLEESKYVFIEQNNLVERFSELKENHTFTIGELGFGTGLNFFNTITHFQTHAHQTNQLNFISFEKFPIIPQQLQQIISSWKTSPIENLTQPFISQYTKLRPNTFNHLTLLENKINLYLYVGDAEEGLQNTNLPTQVNAWYFDGFSPSKNPKLWQPTLFEKIAFISAQNATFSTFSSAGWVRRNIESAGFTVKKAKGFGKKREICCGYLNNVKENL